MSVSVKKFEDPKKVLKIAYGRIRAYCALKPLPPYTLEIQPTTLCPLRCQHCSYWNRNQEEATLPEGTTTSLCNSIQRLGINFVPISGGGEPLTTSYIEKLIQHAHTAGAEVAIITNGVLWERILGTADLLAYIQVSIPAARPITYQNITGASEGILNKVLSMPSYLKDRFHESTPTIGAHVVLTEKNVKEAIAILRKAREKGFDYCTFRFVADFEYRGLYLSKQSLQMLEKSIVENIALIDEDYTNLASLFDKKSKFNGTSYKRCWSLDLRFLSIIDTFGDMYLCVPNIGNREYAIGNVKEQPLEELWNSDRHQQIIEKLQQQYAIGACPRYCRCFRYNAAIEEGIIDNHHLIWSDRFGDQKIFL